MMPISSKMGAVAAALDILTGETHQSDSQPQRRRRRRQIHTVPSEMLCFQRLGQAREQRHSHPRPWKLIQHSNAVDHEQAANDQQVDFFQASVSNPLGIQVSIT